MEELKVHQSKRKSHRRSSSRSSSRRREIDICETNDIQQQQNNVVADATTTTINTESIDTIQPADTNSDNVENINLTEVSNAVTTTKQLKNVPAANITVTTTPPPPVGVAAAAATTTDNNEQTTTTPGGTEKLQTGILTYMDREMKTHRKPPQSLSDPTASPAQRSTRSRSSLEKSPRRKRSKSESRRRRERKMIAAGELEVRQANETLLRYLKQCTEINDASLSGELEIDKSIEDRRVHRKTKSQRERRAMQHGGGVGGGSAAGGGSGTSINGGKSTGGTIRDRIPSSGLTTILTELVDDIMPSHGEIYNPFTPVISPTEGPTQIDKMFIQTSHGYRSVDHSFYKIHADHDIESNR